MSAERPNGSLRLPDQTWRDRIALHPGGKQIRILYPGRAHTRGAVCRWYQELTVGLD